MAAINVTCKPLGTLDVLNYPCKEIKHTVGMYDWLLCYYSYTLLSVQIVLVYIMLVHEAYMNDYHITRQVIHTNSLPTDAEIVNDY